MTAHPGGVADQGLGVLGQSTDLLGPARGQVEDLGIERKVELRPGGEATDERYAFVAENLDDLRFRPHQVGRDEREGPLSGKEVRDGFGAALRRLSDRQLQGNELQAPAVDAARAVAACHRRFEDSAQHVAEGTRASPPDPPRGGRKAGRGQHHTEPEGVLTDAGITDVAQTL